MSTEATPDFPDRLSTDPKSPHHKVEFLQRDVGIRLNGQERHDVEEYCISEGWVRVPVGKTRDRRGNPLTIKLKGKVEPYLKPAATDGAAAPAGAAAAQGNSSGEP